MAKLIVGLGNPGKEYEKTRHNVGFFIVDALAREWGIVLQKKKFKGHYGEGHIDGDKVVLLEPQTFMNLSGECVQPWVDFLKISGKDLLVIYDEIDLPLGRIRGQWGGGAGGHNGLTSVLEKLGRKDFCRLRVGVGRPARKDQVVSYVLAPFAKDQVPKVEAEVQRAVEAVKVFQKLGLDPMMQMVNIKAPVLKTGQADSEIA